MVSPPMTAMCQLCGTPIFDAMPDRVTQEIMMMPIDPAGRDGLLQLNQFDYLAARMMDHLLRHHANEAQISALVQFAAAKVFAATHMESSTEPNFKRLRTSWRKSLLNDLGVYRDEDAPAPAAAADPLAAGTEPAAADGAPA